VQAIYKVAAPYQRSVVDRFSTVAAACRMAIEVGLLPWKVEDTEAGVEACVARWAAYDNFDPTVVAIVTFMNERQQWEGTASQLSKAINGDGAESLGRWLRKSDNVRRLKAAGFELVHSKAKTRERTKMIRIKRKAG
jgi:hypothetical protein